MPSTTPRTVRPAAAARPLRSTSSTGPAGGRRPAEPATAADRDDPVARVRQFSRFYTQRLGLLDRQLLASGYTLTQARVLWELAHRAPLTAAQLRAELSIDAGYLSRLLAGLREQGLVQARRAPHDARAQWLALTARGRRAFARLDGASRDQVTQWLQDMPPASQDHLLGAMDTVHALLAGPVAPPAGAAAGSTAGRARPDPTASAQRQFTGAPSAAGLRDSPSVRPGGLIGEPSTSSLRDSPSGRPGGLMQAPRDAVTLDEPAPGDLGWVVQRHGALYAQEYGFDQRFEALVARICADFVEHFRPGRERGWIARRNGVNLGCVFLVQAPPAEHGEGVAQLRMLLVDPAARGLGLGRRLVEACEAFARAAGYRKIVLWTNSVLHVARAIYQASGYQLVREEPHRSFGQALVGQIWERRLDEPRAPGSAA